ncbi:MAG: hypothetical protein AAF960_18425 [Bacteroidota bacterium]
MSKKRKRHGNSVKNTNAHHLYEIIDIQENDTFKFGISHDPIEADGLSKRLKDQISLYNVVAGFVRFFARILIKNIPNRKEALRIEKQHIQAYKDKHNRKPRGNRKYNLD